MQAGSKILIPDYYGGYSEPLIVEEFRYGLGVFESDAHRTAGKFTPLCTLFIAGADSEGKYISNFGEYLTNQVQGWIDIP